MREQYLVGNWKMNHTGQDIDQFFDDFEKSFSSLGRCHLWLAPQAVHLERVLVGSKGYGMEVGAQNCSQHTRGSWTGEISPVALVEMGARFTLLGHSERRQHYGEDNHVLAEKVRAAADAGLKVVYCIGENLSEREGGKTEEVVGGQLREVLSGFPLSERDKLIVAYEPVWAIGTGKSASGEQIQKVHGLIRKVLSSLKFQSGKIPLLYGGSVKPENIGTLLSCEDIDGALVGGASLDGGSFARMVKEFVR